MMKVRYQHSVDGLQAGQLALLRREWVNPPAPQVTLRSLRSMNAVVLALDAADQVVGFVCGMTDGVLILYVWDLEVTPPWRGQGLERALLEQLLQRHGQIYQVNAHPSAEHRAVFEAAGFAAYRPEQAQAMTRMRMDLQAGAPPACDRPVRDA